MFTYSVVWEQRPELAWASRWDTYLSMSDVQIHWFQLVATYFCLSLTHTHHNNLSHNSCSSFFHSLSGFVVLYYQLIPGKVSGKEICEMGRKNNTTHVYRTLTTPKLASTPPWREVEHVIQLEHTNHISKLYPTISIHKENNQYKMIKRILASMYIQSKKIVVLYECSISIL